MDSWQMNLARTHMQPHNYIHTPSLPGCQTELNCSARAEAEKRQRRLMVHRAALPQAHRCD